MQQVGSFLGYIGHQTNVVVTAASGPTVKTFVQRYWRVPMKSNHISGVMPAFVAGTHVFPYGTSASKTWMAGTSPAMTPQKWFNMNGIRW